MPTHGPLAQPTARTPQLGLALLCLGGSAACFPTNDLTTYGGAGGGGSGAGADAAPPLGSGGAAGTPDGSGGAPAPFQPPVAGAGGGSMSEGPGDAGGAPSSPAGPDDAGAPLTSSDATAPPACAPDEVLGANGRCFFFQVAALAWSDARSTCQGQGPGWDLTSVRSAADAEFLGETLAFEAWIGASDAGQEGTWVWVAEAQPFWSGDADTGAAIDGAYVNWNATEPNGGDATDCARALPDPGAPWADLTCGELRGAICERHSAS